MRAGHSGPANALTRPPARTSSAHAVRHCCHQMGVAALSVPTWLRRNGVNTDGAAAVVVNFDRVREKVTPRHFWEDKSRLTGVPQKSLSNKTFKFAVTPLALTPFVPFRPTLRRAPPRGVGRRQPGLALRVEPRGSAQVVAKKALVNRWPCCRRPLKYWFNMLRLRREDKGGYLFGFTRRARQVICEPGAIRSRRSYRKRQRES